MPGTFTLPQETDDIAQADESNINADALTHMQMNRIAFQSLSNQVQSLATAAAADPTNIQKQQQLERAQQALDVVIKNSADFVAKTLVKRGRT